MAAKESQLTDNELNSLRLESLIFHVWDPKRENDKLRFLDSEIDLDTGEYRSFFLERLRDASRGTQYVFAGKKQSTRELCDELIATPDLLVEHSQKMSEAFVSYHRGRQMAAGVIVVALARVTSGDDILPLVFILKLDHRPALTYTLRTDRKGDVSARVRQIADALVEDRAAVQRSALITRSDKFLWDVLASERNEGPTPSLRHFFKNFLSVELRETASELTRKAVSTVNTWANDLSAEDFAEEESARRFRERAAQYMQSFGQFDTAQFAEMVVRDDDVERKARVMRSLTHRLAEVGVAGQSFDTKPKSLPKTLSSTTLVTAEGVRISYDGDQSSRRVEVQDDPEHGVGAKKIIIRSREIRAT